jgi:hypothetical protein
MDITIQVTGGDELAAKCNDPALFGEPLRDFFGQVTTSIQNDVRVLTPVDTGRLRASVISTVDPSPMPMFGEVGTNVVYGPYVEYGTVPHYPPLAALAVWARRHGMSPRALQRKIGLYGTRGRFMFQTAVENATGYLEASVKDLAEAIEERWGAK